MSKQTFLIPRLSEKSYALSNSRVYVVDVNRTVNKHQIKLAVESQFNVKVKKVNLTNLSGKSKRTISKGGRRVSNGRNNNIKKAYVTLFDGHTLPFFNAIEEEEKQAEKTQAEYAKQQAKAADKESKPKKRSIRTRKSSKSESEE